MIHPDSEYSFYDKLLWRSKVSNLYPKEAKYFVFQHEIRDGIDANSVVESGAAQYMTKEGNWVATHTMISKRNHNPVVWDALMRQRKIETQMALNRLLPEPALSRRIESLSRFEQI